MLFVFSGNNRLSIVKYKVESSKLSQSVRIALVCDLHACMYGEDQNELMQAIDKNEPDAVMLVGDIFDERKPYENALILLRKLANRYICFFVTGNHEHLCTDTDNILSMVSSLNIQILSEEMATLTVRGQNICIYGIPASGNIEPFANTDTEDFSILLMHRPQRAPDHENFDLILSGHTHGGQIRIPGLCNGIYAPGQGWFPKYAGGRYLIGNNQMIVSRGLSKGEMGVPRLFNRPELVIIDLLPIKNEPTLGV